jgi:PKD repeat protein
VPNVGPTASFTHTETGLKTDVNGAASTDPDGSIVAYAWTFGDGATTTGVTASHTYAAAGTYTVRLTVTDDDGATNAVSHAVTVAVPPPRYEDVVTGDGAIHYWKYNEASGTTAADSIGALTATFGAAPLPTRGTAPIAPGLGLSTTAPNIEPGAQSTTANLPVALNTWTWEVWLNPTDMPGGYGNFGDVWGNFRIGFSPGWRGIVTPSPSPNYASPYIIVEINSVTPVSVHVPLPEPIAFDTTAHIVLTVAPTEFRLYVNGAHAATRTFTGTPLLSNYARIPLADRKYVGRFSDTAIYPTVLTSAQIANHYAVGMAPRPATTTAEARAADPAEVQVVTIGGAQFADIRNIVSVSRQAEDGANEAATVTVRDEASAARYLRRSYARTDLQHQDDNWSATVANAILASSAWPSRAPREAELSSRLGDPDTPALLLGLEPDHTFDVEDTAGVLWREGCMGWQVTVGTKSIDGTIQLTDVGRWVGGRWDSGVWDTDRWSYAVTIPGLEEA